MKRRNLLALLGGAAAALPWTGRAQRPRRIGVLCGVSADACAPLLAAFRHGLEETGYTEGRNLQIEYRWADDDTARLPTLAADLVRASVEVIATSGGLQPASAAMQATAAIPIVSSSAGGLVKHFNRPEGNLTGLNFLTSDLTPKRLQLPHRASPRRCDRRTGEPCLFRVRARPRRGRESSSGSGGRSPVCDSQYRQRP